MAAHFAYFCIFLIFQPACKYCGLRLTPKALKIHELNHLGEKPYACEFCDFRSASKASVKNHKLSRHTAE